ncbi:uncharacterized protein LOC124413710 isoform X1 [Diprion similis]|uniref:uncharacterized protein LOC124413710 isoform X1 n=1 Tax=Diprion similis TaxID=362088 RepID=UPI001EF9011C|nr:uncharacterized protein LOC124413710 isoform X1 [Diprion similis]
MTSIFAVERAVILSFVCAIFASVRCREVVGNLKLNDINEKGCRENQFTCQDGNCISEELLCDGRADCSDRSDETTPVCEFSPDDGFNTYTIKSTNRSKRAAQRTPSSCLVPPQPSNGHWKLHRALCDDGVDCDVSQDIKLEPGSRLLYTCFPNYKATGATDVFCEVTGTWSEIPECIEVKCSTLNSPSTTASCYRSGQLVSCDSTMSPGIRAEVFCRQGYKKETSSLTSRREVVMCNSDGKWEPDPIRCIPVCGVARIEQSPLVYNGIKANVSDFPWHATLYKEESTDEGPKKEFQCGATIIHTNLVMTAAHCIYDEYTQATENPEKFFIVTGNTFRDYDSSLHDPRIVQKARVKNIYMHCQYYGLGGNYVSDIALLELKQPFEFSSFLQPACLDLSGYGEQILDSSVFGRVAGFGRTATGTTSAVLQTLTLPYIPYNKCKTLNHNLEIEVFISHDKFCAGYKNGSAVCEGDSGGGLVFMKNDLWYVMGIVSVGLGVDTSSGEKTCDKYSYSLYTKVSTYMTWIQDVIFELEQHKSYPVCRPYRPQPPTPKTTKEIPSSAVVLYCKVPPHPAHGEWRLHPSICEGRTDCTVPQGASLEAGDQLVYSCMPGFRLDGSPYVFCGLQGNWTTIPICVDEIICPSLNSASTAMTCLRQSTWTQDCNSTALPYSTASLICRPGYTEDATPGKAGSKYVRCNANGQWEPKPITCLPMCGITNTHSTRTVLNGIVFDLPHFPWHAMVYKQKKASQDPKEFQCGATIIQDNLLLTAAHCVYDHVLKTVEIPEKFHVITGNKFRDYDSPLHDSRIVQKAAVKSIHIPCEYSGSQSNYYGSDIAIIELQKPFKLSGVSNPVCMDVLGTKERLVKSGSVGRLAGFGRTGSGPSTATLVTTNNPYIALSECTVSNNNEDKELTGNDKFCVGSGNGTDSCEGDSGGGLVFENDGNWYVMGVLSTSFRPSSGNGTCDGNATSLYTKVPAYMSWIRKVISSLERHQSFPPCKPSV